MTTPPVDNLYYSKYVVNNPVPLAIKVLKPAESLHRIFIIIFYNADRLKNERSVIDV